ncbi:DUF4998 domain-containing protein [Pedobacter suwonensis]|nr:DUF4998 domain-containing protein [uncultured Pedobacter sp.]
MDDYKNIYQKNGPIIYPGKIDSLKAFAGKNRVMLTGLFTSDPKITKYTVYWNSRQDSIVVPVKRTKNVDTVKTIISNLPEGIASFEVRTSDTEGHISIPVNIAANVYGALYQSSLLNRGISDAAIQPDGSALIIWADVNKDAGVKFMHIRYADNNDKTHDTLVVSSPTAMVTRLPNFKIGKSLSYRTAFLPEATAIDQFYTDYQSRSVKADVTKLYISNTGPFTRGAFDGNRWGILAAPWVTNATVINHSGYGGYATDSGGSLVMESGWSGSPNIINGKIYQTVTLPAGNYIFQVNNYTEALDPVYVVVASGNTLPDISSLSTALSFKRFSSKLYTDEVIQVPFTLTQSQAVSLGFLSTMQSGNQYWRVTAVSLLSN